MANLLRRIEPLAAIVALGVNDAMRRVGAGASFHLDKCEQTITSANATDLPTSLALVNEIWSIYKFHLADTLALKVAGTAPALVVAVDLATAITLANGIKADYNTHCASVVVHYNADATNTTSSANASDQTTLNTLLNELKTDLTAHLIGGPAAGAMIRLVDA
jgi:hypothetical protein